MLTARNRPTRTVTRPLITAVINSRNGNPYNLPDRKEVAASLCTLLSIIRKAVDYYEQLDPETHYEAIWDYAEFCSRTQGFSDRFLSRFQSEDLACTLSLKTGPSGRLAEHV